jgi:hypothetical protein
VSLRQELKLPHELGGEQSIDQAEFVRFDFEDSHAAPAASAAPVLPEGCGAAGRHC